MVGVERLELGRRVAVVATSSPVSSLAVTVPSMPAIRALHTGMRAEVWPEHGKFRGRRVTAISDRASRITHIPAKPGSFGPRARRCNIKTGAWAPGEGGGENGRSVGLIAAARGRRVGRDGGAVVDQDDRPDRSRAGHEALRAGQARRRQPDRIPRRGRLPGPAVDAGPALQAVADLRREEVPVGAGAGGRDRCGDRAGRRAAADRRQERRLQARVRQLLRRARASSTAAGRRVCSALVLPPGTLLPIHPVAFMVHHVAQGLRPLGVARSRRAGARQRAGRCTPRRSGSRPNSCKSW